MDLINKKEVGEFLKVSQKTVYNLMKSKELPYIKIGGSIRFIKQDIIKYINNQKNK